jgi:cell division protein ZapA
MGQVTITIDKREYAITCDDGQEGHIIKLSRILDEKAKMLSKSVGLINENMMLAMVALVLADEMQDIKDGKGGISAEEYKKSDLKVAATIDEQTAKIKSLIHEIKAV